MKKFEIKINKTFKMGQDGQDEEMDEPKTLLHTIVESSDVKDAYSMLWAQYESYMLMCDTVDVTDITEGVINA